VSGAGPHTRAWLVLLSDRPDESALFDPPGKRLFCELDSTHLIWTTGTDADGAAYRYQAQSLADSLVGTLFIMKNDAPQDSFPLTLQRIASARAGQHWPGFYSSFALHEERGAYLGTDLLLYETDAGLTGLVVHYDGSASAPLPLLDVRIREDSLQFSVPVSSRSAARGTRYKAVRTADTLQLITRGTVTRLSYQGPAGAVFQRLLLHGCFRRPVTD
jgi:hypothetical protein